MKKVLSVLLVLALTLSLVACGGGKAPAGSSQSPDASSPDASSAAGTDVRVGLVSSSSGFGDGAFNDLTLKGLDKAKAELGIEYDKVAIKAVGDIELSLRDMASTEDYDLIIALTYEAIDAMKAVSAEFPEQKFALIDTEIEAPNVTCYTTADEEASFIVGAVAAMMKQNSADYGLGTDKKLGFIGGVDAPNIRVFYSGFAAGAKYIDKDMVILDDYVGGFTDITTTKEIATSMNSQGADVIFHAAGMSGNGLFQAAKENGTKAFGVNLNQNAVEPSVIVGSMIKNVDVAAYDAIKSVVRGTFEAKTRRLTMADGGVDMATEGSEVNLSEEITTKIAELRNKIGTEEIRVPSTVDALAEFEKGLA
ncbi:BMP family ABC transporter substrate-binding protein [Hydrogenoanaerobacterium sp.]|uniref:BMP family lipoprotein n=1 Tax=Hydrogenoanaerobacterium sp. TaxID=2953763 RepID=UPI00289EAC7D|nr:BMP family ABC transporter substrate-binding protein [Hydrogenoanaerobacterium sp.]